MAQKQIDTRGLTCPISALKTKKALAALDTGDTLEVLATDSSAPEDLSALCQTLGHTIVESSQAGDDYRVVIKKEA